jgi:hypothetical protein
MKVDYVDVAGCSTLDGFSHEVRSRSTRVRLAAPAEQVRTFRVMVRRAGMGVVEGEATGPAPGGALLRVVARGTCDKVIGVLAFGIAFTLDPFAESEPTADALPENPYWAWLARLPSETPLPENPYYRASAARERHAPDETSMVLPSNPYR